jgi:hypothetical protein
MTSNTRAAGLQARMDELIEHIDMLWCVRRLMVKHNYNEADEALADAIGLLARERANMGEELFWHVEPRIARELAKKMESGAGIVRTTDSASEGLRPFNLMKGRKREGGPGKAARDDAIRQGGDEASWPLPAPAEATVKNCNTCFFGGNNKRTSDGCDRAMNHDGACVNWSEPS